jgi:YidC/Oxa1 family membrane protein insertase
MNFDRNTVIGFVLLALLFFGYFYILNTEQSEVRQRQAREQFVRDSLAVAQAPAVDSKKLVRDSILADSVERLVQAGSFKPSTDSTALLFTLENKQI